MESLLAQMHENNPRIREMAAYKLGRIKDPRIVQLLVEKLKDTDSNGQTCAIWALEDIRDGRAAKPLLDSLHDAARVVYTPKGIITDARMRTKVPHICACGNVNGQFPFTHVAGYEGAIALTNACLHLPRKADYTKVPWCTYTDTEVASIGINEKRAKGVGSNTGCWRIPLGKTAAPLQRQSPLVRLRS